MNPLDTAEVLKALVDSGWCIEKIAETLGYDSTTVERKLSLNNLEARIQDYVVRGQISESVAQLLTKLSGAGQYLALRLIRGRSLPKRVRSWTLSLRPSSRSICSRHLSQHVSSKALAGATAWMLVLTAFV